MEHLAKRVLFEALKSYSGQTQSTGNIRLFRACFCNTVHQRTEGLNGTAGESRHSTRIVENDDTNNNNNNNNNHGENVEMMSGVTGFVADTVVRGTLGAAKMAEALGDTAKEVVDTAWDSTKNAARSVQDTVIASADNNVVDTSEYRSITEDQVITNNKSNDIIGDHP